MFGSELLAYCMKRLEILFHALFCHSELDGRCNVRRMNMILYRTKVYER